MKSWCKKLLTAGLIFMTAVAAVKTPMPVYADEVSGNSVQYITDDDRWRASVELKNYKESLIKRENPEQYIIDDLDDITRPCKAIPSPPGQPSELQYIQRRIGRQQHDDTALFRCSGEHGGFRTDTVQPFL